MELRDAPADWLEGYGGLDAGVFAASDERRVREVLAWFREHGAARFSDLDIWRVDWAALCTDQELAEAIRDASRGAPANAPKILPLTASVRRHMVAAGEHIARGDLNACRKSVECALAESPGHPELLAALGNVQFVAKEFSNARKNLEASLAISPGQPKVWAQLAATQLRLKNQAGFLTALQKALELDAECIPALRLMADHQAQRGQHLAAAGAYRKLAQLAPRDAKVLLQLGQSLAAAGESDEAAQALRQALAVDSNLTAARSALNNLERKNRNVRSAPLAESLAR
jgi:tetratricopeptide (TPR) repeat protein